MKTKKRLSKSLITVLLNSFSVIGLSQDTNPKFNHEGAVSKTSKMKLAFDYTPSYILTMNDGTQLKGRIINETKTEVVFLDNKTGEQSIDSDKIKSVRPELLNEIGINIKPILLATLSAIPMEERNRFSITYKRNLTTKSALRVGLCIDKAFISQSFAFQKADTTMNKYMRSDYLSPHINLGYERTLGAKKLKLFYGADLIIGYYEKKDHERYYKTFKDSTSGPTLVHIYPEEMVGKARCYRFGLSPFVGAKYSLTKRFSVSVQAGTDITYQWHNKLNSKNNYENNQVLNFFDLGGAAGLINDVSIIYKF